ncbi:MAG TPA: phospholipase D family protein [Longimicrobium sp.]
MPSFLTTLSTSSHIEQVIQQSQKRLTLITPYLRVSQHLLDRMREADRSGVEIQLVYGKNELRQEEMARLGELKRLKLYFLRHLHAKCYANERHVIISSMNLHEFSEKNNREMSVAPLRRRRDRIHGRQGGNRIHHQCRHARAACGQVRRRGARVLLGSLTGPHARRTEPPIRNLHQVQRRDSLPALVSAL